MSTWGERMAGTGGNLGTTSYGATPKEGWMEALRVLTDEMIFLGFDRLMKEGSYYPPNAMQFRKLCKPAGEDFGLMTENEAYKQAIAHRRADRAPEVVFTMQAMGGSYDFGRKKSNEARKQFNDWYAKTVDHVLNGGKLPEPVLEVEHKRLRTPNKEGQAKIQAIMAMISQ